MARTITPVIPDKITVHLGPPKSDAKNVSVSFPDYIKNVASSEIYPTWPEEAIKANVYAQISFALNRIVSDWYPSRGYDFDITSSPAYDQAYVQGRDTFLNVDKIVDDVFNEYVRKKGELQPLFTQYCNGTTSKCGGLSQWGTVDYAKQGLDALAILKKYYGDDIEIVKNTPVASIPDSYGGKPIKLGDVGDDVKKIQLQLNRISTNYPSIPKIPDIDGVFGVPTENAVKEFQKSFNLTQDGIVGKGTWYKIAYAYSAVKKLAELDSEGISLAVTLQQFKSEIKQGDKGQDVKSVQVYLDLVAEFNDNIPAVKVDGDFGPETKQSVIAFQKEYGLKPDGIVGPKTWDKIYDVYMSIVSAFKPGAVDNGVPRFRGVILKFGSKNPQVKELQKFLNKISKSFKSIPPVEETGYFGKKTQDAVLAYEKEFGLPTRGIVGPIIWESIASLYTDLVAGEKKTQGQFGGKDLKEV